MFKSLLLKRFTSQNPYTAYWAGLHGFPGIFHWSIAHSHPQLSDSSTDTLQHQRKYE